MTNQWLTLRAHAATNSGRSNGMSKNGGFLRFFAIVATDWKSAATVRIAPAAIYAGARAARPRARATGGASPRSDRSGGAPRRFQFSAFARAARNFAAGSGGRGAGVRL